MKKQNHKIGFLKITKIRVGITVFILLAFIDYLYSAATGSQPNFNLVVSSIVNALYAFVANDNFQKQSADEFLFIMKFLLMLSALAVSSYAVVSIAFEPLYSKIRLNYLKIIGSRKFYYLDFNVETREDAEKFLQNSQEKDYVFLYGEDDALNILPEMKSRVLKISSITKEKLISSQKLKGKEMGEIFFRTDTIQITKTKDDKAIHQKSEFMMRKVLGDTNIYEDILGKHRAAKILIIGKFDLLFEVMFKKMVIFFQNPYEKPDITLMTEYSDAFDGDYLEALFPSRELVVNVHIIERSEFKKEISDYDIVFIGNQDDSNKRRYVLYLLQYMKGHTEFPIYVFDPLGNVGKEFDDNENVTSFGDFSEINSPLYILEEELDKKAQKVNAAYSGIYEDDAHSKEELGKLQNKITDEWNRLEEYDRSSSRASADFLTNESLLISKGYSDEEVAKVEHKRWNAYFAMEGYTRMLFNAMIERYNAAPEVEEVKNGKVKRAKYAQEDKIEKQHICLVSWDELSEVSVKYLTMIGEKPKLEYYQKLDENIVGIAKRLAN